MALNDKIVVAIDAGQRQPEEVTVRVGTPGGTVDYGIEDGLVKVRERTRSGVVRQCLVVRPERLVMLRQDPR